MSPAEVSTKSRIIGRKLLDYIEWNQYRHICAYEPIAGLNEVDIKGVVSRLKNRGNKISIIGRAKKAELPKQNFELIIVPCLAFDEANYRLGWGGGYYDKFLANQPQALKIGVCFSNGLVENGLPHEPHDVQLDKLVTETGESGLR
jgi:5-formyltetrahydrofolate cyclo-ligase